MRFEGRAHWLLVALCAGLAACVGGGDARDLAGEPGPSEDTGPEAPDAVEGPDDPGPSDPAPGLDPGIDPGPAPDPGPGGPPPIAAWTVVEGAPDFTAAAIRVNDDDDVWVVGKIAQGVAHWDGEAWTRRDGPRGKGYGATTVWSPGPGVVWADGARWDGTAWVDAWQKPAVELSALWGSGPDDVWAIPGGADVGWWNGTAWVPVRPGVEQDSWVAVAGSGPADVWLAGYGWGDGAASARVLHWDGKTWEDRSSGLSRPVQGLWVGAGTAWACGDGGVLARWDGAWVPVPSPLPSCSAIWGTGPGDLWMTSLAAADLVARGGPGGWIRVLTSHPVRYVGGDGTATSTWLVALGGGVIRLDRAHCGPPAPADACCALGFGRCRLDPCEFPAVVTEACPDGCAGCPTLCLPRFQVGCCGCTPGCTEEQCAAATDGCRYDHSCWQDACGAGDEIVDSCSEREYCRSGGCWRVPCTPGCPADRCDVEDGCGGTCDCPWAGPRYCCDGICSADECCGRCGPDQKCLWGTCCTGDCDGRICGGDGCGGMCGLCPSGETCCNDHCSPDPCCGRCGEGEGCVPWSGECVRTSCPPTGGCGWDDYGFPCGETCPEGQRCCDDHRCRSNGECCEACDPPGRCLPVPWGDPAWRECCRPGCEGRECGGDGCGGMCGTCPEGTACTLESRCSPLPCGGECTLDQVCLGLRCCTPGCRSKTCGPDGCGGDCGGCPEGAACNGGFCCTPTCQGKACGSDNCGGSCGECPEGSWCCSGKCGSDACCGTCLGDQVCFDGRCCTPKCYPGTVCGDDRCGGTCGDCPEGQLCREDRSGCCTRDCSGRVCGGDGCGGACGDCPPGTWCCGDGQCSPVPCCGCPEGQVCLDGRCIVPSCGSSICGPGQGTTCGLCPEGAACLSGFCCVRSCEGRECGSDGCDGECGGCASGRCDWQAGRCLDPCGDCVPGQVCLDDWCCTPYCGDQECGSDHCGGSCGECTAPSYCGPNLRCTMDACGDACTGGQVCFNGACGCVPDRDTVCGPDGAAWWVDSCGVVGEKVRDCANGCQDGRCVGCTPDCAGRACGDDGCGGSCGGCDPGARCFDPPGTVPECRPSRGLGCCGDRLCKEWRDPWDGAPLRSLYGTCPDGCWKGWCLGCAWACNGKDCGDDGCGGQCGTCPAEAACVDGRCLG